MDNMNSFPVGANHKSPGKYCTAEHIEPDYDVYQRGDEKGTNTFRCCACGKIIPDDKTEKEG